MPKGDTGIPAPGSNLCSFYYFPTPFSTHGWGNDSLDNLLICLDSEIKADFIIKRNLRKETPEAWLAIAKENGTATAEWEGKPSIGGTRW